MNRICIVAGARPNFVKIAPIINELELRNIDYYLVNTGQHYDNNMAGILFKELGIKTPNYNLGVGGGSHATQTGNIMIEFEKVLKKEKTNLVVVVGFQNNVFNFIKKADCFILNSYWESFGQVLVEALIMNKVVISTDCESGPREILAPENYQRRSNILILVNLVF